MGDVFLKLLNMSITAGWLIIAVLCVRFLFRKIPKWVNCLLWGVVAIRLIFPISIESEFSLQPSAEPIQSGTMVEGKILPYVPSVDSNLAIVENTVNPILTEAFAYQEAESVAPLQLVTGIAGSVWLCGMIVLLVFAMGSTVRLYLLVRESVHYRDNVYICDAVKSPFILGTIKPRIYLSSSLSEDEMDYIIAHEKAHLRRRDHLWKPFGYLLLCVYWFHPLCLTAYIMLCKDIELACDEKVIRNMGFDDKKEYSRVLLSCAAQRRLVFVCPLAFGEVGVKERVKSVLHYKKPALWITIAAIVVCVIVAVCFLTNPSREYQIRITIPAGSTAVFCYSDEEISPKGNTLTLANGDGLGDTEVVLLPVEVREENAYDKPAYMTPGMPVKMDVEKGAWFKIGVNMQNPTAEDMDVYVSVSNVVVRIASAEGEEVPEFDGTDTSQETELDDSGQPQENAGIQDLAYYLELSASDIQFQNMSEERKAEILAGYGNLLDGYTLMARESVDGRTAYIVGHYNGDTAQSSLYNMQTMNYSGKTLQKSLQVLYLEENYEALNRVLDEEGALAISEEGYVIWDSNLYWSGSRDYILIQPVDSALNIANTFGLYHTPSRGRAYIEDALSRGIALNTVAEPYLSIYMISEKWGEITENIPLTQEEANRILSGNKRKHPKGYGFAASLYMNGESIYYSENGVPESVLDLAVEKCGYQFASPDSITASIKDACLDCSWM